MFDERDLIVRLRDGNREAFSLLFGAYYKDLVLFGGNFFPGDRDTCEDAVQSVFLKLWDDHRLIVIGTSLKSYLLKAVHNACLDELRHRNVVHEHESYVQATGFVDETDTENYILDGLEGKLTSSKWGKMTKTSPDTALRDIQDLISKGILQKEAQGGRSTNYELNMN